MLKALDILTKSIINTHRSMKLCACSEEVVVMIISQIITSRGVEWFRRQNEEIILTREPVAMSWLIIQ